LTAIQDHRAPDQCLSVLLSRFPPRISRSGPYNLLFPSKGVTCVCTHDVTQTIVTHNRRRKVSNAKWWALPCVRRAFVSWAHVELPRKDNTFVGAVLLTGSLYVYRYVSLYASRGVRCW